MTVPPFLIVLKWFSVISNIISVTFGNVPFLVEFKRFPVILKGTSFIDFMTGVPVIINGIPLNLNGRNLKEVQLKKKCNNRIIYPIVQLQ
jgi:hypothetical protein